jgi:hypothetical protein
VGEGVKVGIDVAGGAGGFVAVDVRVIVGGLVGTAEVHAVNKIISSTIQTCFIVSLSA